MNLDWFVGLLGRSLLCTQEELPELVRSFKSEHRESANDEDAVGQLCDYLINNKVITKLQCDLLRTGKWKGFYLGDYLVLEPIGKHLETSHYKARDTTSGRLMRLTLTGINTNDEIGYEVEPLTD